ncbi:MAG TPA: efflux RND transporter periplasmic adaptor subunit [Phycisphaerae bacterium]
MNDSAHHDRLAGLAIDASRRPAPSSASRVWLLAIVFAAGGVMGLAAWWYFRVNGQSFVQALAEQPVEVRLLAISEAKPGEAASLIAGGRIVSDRLVYVATKVSGQIVQMNVEQGDSVVAGQVLARLEDDTYRAQCDEADATVTRYERELARSQSEQRRAEAALRQAQADLEFETRNYERLRDLHAVDNASELEFMNAKSRYDAAQAAGEMARASVESAGLAVEVVAAQLKGAQATLRVFRKHLEDCDIQAPISGVVIERSAQVGDFVAAEGGRGANANAQLAVIADMSRLRVDTDVSERDVHRLSVGQAARITPDAAPDHRYEGHVLWIDPASNYAKATVQVKVRIHDPQASLRINGSARVEFIGDGSSPARGSASSGAVWLPLSAVRLSPGSENATVFTVVDGRAMANAVTIGARTDQRVEVISGVRAGMPVVVDNLERLTSGTRLIVKETVSSDGW